MFLGGSIFVCTGLNRTSRASGPRRSAQRDQVQVQTRVVFRFEGLNAVFESHVLTHVQNANPFGAVDDQNLDTRINAVGATHAYNRGPWRWKRPVGSGGHCRLNIAPERDRKPTNRFWEQTSDVGGSGRQRIFSGGQRCLLVSCRRQHKIHENPANTPQESTDVRQMAPGVRLAAYPHRFSDKLCVDDLVAVADCEHDWQLQKKEPRQGVSFCSSDLREPCRQICANWDLPRPRSCLSARFGLQRDGY